MPAASRLIGTPAWRDAGHCSREHGRYDHPLAPPPPPPPPRPPHDRNLRPPCYARVCRPTNQRGGGGRVRPAMACGSGVAPLQRSRRRLGVAGCAARDLGAGKLARSGGRTSGNGGTGKRCLARSAALPRSGRDRALDACSFGTAMPRQPLFGALPRGRTVHVLLPALQRPTAARCTCQ